MILSTCGRKLMLWVTRTRVLTGNTNKTTNQSINISVTYRSSTYWYYYRDWRQTNIKQIKCLIKLLIVQGLKWCKTKYTCKVWKQIHTYVSAIDYIELDAFLHKNTSKLLSRRKSHLAENNSSKLHSERGNQKRKGEIQCTLYLEASLVWPKTWNKCPDLGLSDHDPVKVW